MLQKNNLILLMSIFLLLFFIGESIGQQRTFTIKGKIVDEDTGSPLVGASISIQNTALGAVSNVEGFFKIQNIPEGMYTIKFSYVGCVSFQLDSVYINSDTTLSDVLLEFLPPIMCDFRVYTTDQLNAIRDAEKFLQQDSIIIISYNPITSAMETFAHKYNFTFRKRKKFLFWEEDSVYVNFFNEPMRDKLWDMYGKKVMRKIDSLLNYK